MDSGSILENEDRVFPNNLPNVTWIHRFVKRHDNLSARTPEHLGHQRKGVTEHALRGWFESLENFLLTEHKINARDFLTPGNSHRVFNLDEAGFPLSGGSKLKIIAETGAKNVYNVATESKEQVTVLGCVSGDGNCQKPFVLFPGVRPTFHFKSVDPSKYDVGNTPNGWISSEAFFGWLSNLFYPAIKEKVQFPVLVFMDGHSSHINLAVADFCRKHEIILFCFPPHASHIIQPLDISVYGPLKKQWNTSVNNFKVKFNQMMNRASFFTVFDEAWEACRRNKQNIISGFRKAGLIPFDPNALDYSRLINEEVIAKEFNQSGSHVSAEQKLGIMRALKCFDQNLPENTMKLFEKRFEEQYDAEGDSDAGKLYSIYKSVKLLLDEKSASSQTTESSNTVSANLNSTTNALPADLTISAAVPTVFTEPGENLNPINQASTSSVEIPVKRVQNLLSPIHTVTIQIPDEQASSVSPATDEVVDIQFDDGYEIPSVEPSGSSSRNDTNEQRQQMSSTLLEDSAVENSSELNVSNAEFYGNWKYSPFKKYLSISENLVTRKETRMKPVHPPAVTGNDYYRNMLEKQKTKEQEQQKKTERKQIREKKKAEREANAKKGKGNRKGKQPMNTMPQEDWDIVYADDTDDEEFDESNECRACGGDEGQNEIHKWIGCNRCTRWFHKYCLSEEYEIMSLEEIKELNFICNFCLSRTK